MLEDLDTIDWSKLTHAYGSAHNVPTLIRTLASPSPVVWEQALDDLESCILHQGTLYEATAFAVPFLIELLQTDAIQCRDKLIQLLGYIGNATDNCVPSDVLSTTLHEAVTQGRKTYLKLLEDSKPDVRMYALYTLGTLHEQADGSIPLLIYTYFQRETDPCVRASFVYYLSSHMEHLPDGQNLLSDMINAQEEHALVKVVAALTQVQQSKEQTPHSAVQILLDALVNPDGLEKMYATLPWQSNSLIGTMSNFLCLLSYNVADMVIPALLERLKYLDQSYQLRKASHKKDPNASSVSFHDDAIIYQDYVVPDIVHALLHFAFQGKPLPANAIPFLLTNTQRAVLTAIINSDTAAHFTTSITEYKDEFLSPPLWKIRLLLKPTLQS